MTNNPIFKFETDISKLTIPLSLNNPFGGAIPAIARAAASQFQTFITNESISWKHDFRIHKGKMFGVLVVEKLDGSLGYLGTVSGGLEGRNSCERFVPTIFDDKVPDNFMNIGMTELSYLSKRIRDSQDHLMTEKLKIERKIKSFNLQKRLFESYEFKNQKGRTKNLIQIFRESQQGNPPSAAGECAGPKLFQYAFEHTLKPIAFAEFWWGLPTKNGERIHKETIAKLIEFRFLLFLGSFFSEILIFSSCF